MINAVVLILGAAEPTLAEQALTWAQANVPLAILGVAALVVLAMLPKLLGGGVKPGQAPRSPKQARVWAERAMAKNDMRTAGEYYLFAGDYDEAVNAYSRAGLFDDAAEAAMAGGLKDRAAVMLEKAKKYAAAAKIYQQAGKFKLAGELFVKAKNDTLAAECYDAGGDFAKAAEFYEKGQFVGKAADCYVKARDFKRAGAMFERAFREEHMAAKNDARKLKTAAELAAKGAACFEKLNENKRAVALLSDAGLYEKAAQLLTQAKDFDSAAELLVKANRPLQAAELYKQMGEHEKAARLKAEVLRGEGNELAAADSYRQGGEFLEAAEIYRRFARFAEAAACYVQTGDYLQAGEMFLRAKELRKAAEAWERAGDNRRAAEVYQRLGDSKKQSELLERAGEFYEAGFNYFSLKMPDDALRVLGQVPKEHPAFKKACVLLGDLYRERGNAQMAVKKYQEAIDGEKVNQGNLHPYYNLARVLEDSGDPRLALALYTKIQNEDSQYTDVAQRMGTLRQRVQAAAPVQKERTAPPESSSAAPVARPKKRYTLLSELGRGGMGIVYKAHDSVLDRVVAFKMLPSDLRGNDIAVKNFLREAKAAAGLNHPNIVIVYDTGEEAGNYYIAMEYIEGRTLRDITAGDGKIAIPGLLVISSQLCKALEYAHGRNVVHRDIKGSNIMWTDQKLVKIMDFGLAKVIQEVVNFQTVVGGTPHYMAPEQILGEEIDKRADLYSLGVTLYECATGTVPFPKGDVGYHHIHTPPPDPREFAKDIPEEFARILLKCLEKDPANRYQDASEIYQDLKKVPVR
jgi:tetratricopeptide (TPR) repeat protein